MIIQGVIEEITNSAIPQSPEPAPDAPASMPARADGDQPRWASVIAANAALNQEAMWWRSPRWRAARQALWRFLDGHLVSGAAVAVVGAGNAHDLPLWRMCRRALAST